MRASILRISDIDGELQYSLRFIKLKTDDDEVFQQLLGFLADSGDDDSGQRKNARLAQRIDIQYDNTNDLKVTLEDISSGGMGITVPEPMELNQSLLTVISTTDQKCQLAIRARVVRQESGDSSNIEVFRAGLEFEHSTEDLQHRINKLIRKIASTNPGNNI